MTALNARIRRELYSALPELAAARGMPLECVPNAKAPARCSDGGFVRGSLAVTYFRERKLTIIGATLFHGPVREGKGWDQRAIAAKRNGDVCRGTRARRKTGRKVVCCDCYELLQCDKVIGSSRTGN
jgi:hypothetical protein